MSDTLPQGWVMTTIDDLTIETPQHRPPADEEFTYIDISSIDREAKRIRTPQQLIGQEAPSRARKSVAAGDVLVSMTRPNLNAVALVPPELDGQIASTGFDVLRGIHIDPRWLYYTVRSDDFVVAMSSLVQGALYPAVRPRDIRGYQMRLAPIPEQVRIADKLDTLLARVNACRTRLERIPLILMRFRQSVLAAATSGQLTEDWRDKQEVWQTVSLGSILREIRYGTAKRSSYEIIDGTPVLRIPNIGDGRIDPADLKFGYFDEREVETLSVKAGDLLIIRSNGSLGLVGKAAIVEPEFEGFLFAGYLIRLRLELAIIDPYYLWAFLSSPNMRLHIENTARSTSGVNNINTQEIQAIQVYLPCLDEQREIVRRVDNLFAYANRLEARYQAARAKVEQLTPALLAKAFRGELVPQDPDDEPASMLLERIRTERASQSQEKDSSRQLSLSI